MSGERPLIVTVATDESFDLAEGPIWDPVREVVLWVDIRAGTVLSGTLRDDGTIRIDERASLPGMVGAVAVSAAGEWIVAGERGIVTRTPSGRWQPGATLLANESGRRLNDGKADPAGRFVVGTLKLDETETHEERLIVVQPDGSFDDLDGDLGLSNGLAWTVDGMTLYSVDTAARTIYARPYDPGSGVAGPRRAFLSFEPGVNPDGICLDADGFLWVAIWGGAEVRRYSPLAIFDRRIEVPAPHVTSLTFAGRDLATMVITTASKDLSTEQLAAFPLAGRLFTVDAGVRGLPPLQWAGLPQAAAADAASFEATS